MEPALNPFSFIDGFGGLPLAVRHFGKMGDPPVVLVPGATRDARTWHAVADALVARGRFVTLVDLRGHGASDPSPDGLYTIDRFIGDLREVLRMQDARPVLVAATLTGWAALLCIGEGEPDLASALVLVEVSDQFDPASLAEIEREIAEAPDQNGFTTFDKAILGQIEPPALSERLSASAKRIRIPTLLVRGEASKLVSSEQMAGLAAQIGGCETTEIASADQLNLILANGELAAAIGEFVQHRAPGEPLSYVAGSDQRTLRDAMGCFATGVTVVTTRTPEGEPVGITANSFTSVSLDPPLLLVCPGKSIASLSAFEACSHFAINVLHIRQQAASNLFATKGADKFAGVNWETWGHNVPILTNSLVSFECEKHSMQDAGDHKILMGRVVRASFHPIRDPLLFFRGKYRRLHLG